MRTWYFRSIVRTLLFGALAVILLGYCSESEPQGQLGAWAKEMPGTRKPSPVKADGTLAPQDDRIESVIFDPQIPSTIYVVTHGVAQRENQLGIFKSTDSGATWSLLNLGTVPVR